MKKLPSVDIQQFFYKMWIRIDFVEPEPNMVAGDCLLASERGKLSQFHVYIYVHSKMNEFWPLYIF